jgi:dipeptidyl-peptidase 4
MTPSIVFLALALSADVPPERLQAALSLPRRTENTVFRDRVAPQWLPGGKAFWYRVQTGPTTHEFVLIDAETGARTTAEALAKLGLPDVEPLRTSALPVVLRRSARTGSETRLKLVNLLDGVVELFWINPAGEPVPYGEIAPGGTGDQHTYDGHVWLIGLRDGGPLAVIEAQATPITLHIDGPGTPPTTRGPSRAGRGANSPDGTWNASIDNGVVHLRHRETGETRPLPTDLDGTPAFRGRIAWAPDSSAFVVSHTPDVPQRKITLVDSSPKDELQPKRKEIDYTKPGDPLPQPTPVIFRITADGHTWQAVSRELFPNPFTEADHVAVTWSPDSREFYFDYNQRGHQVYRVLAVNAQTAAVRTVVEETSDTFIDYRQKTWRHWLHDTNELLWTSERDGWCHLWLYDTATGQVKHPVTQGDWPVREVLHVDEELREVWFLASGLRPGEDPYHKHLCRASIDDGGDVVRLTEGDGNHRVEFSPDRQYFVDTWSRADHPPVHELRRSRDGTLVCTLETAEIVPLLAAGWTMPERFVAPGRDGVTEIHGIIIKPSHFDPTKQYPVVEEIYAGPHSAFVPKEFGRLLRQHTFAELGFIVVQIDGMGTNHRGKAFHDVCWKNLKDSGFPDRVAWIKAAAATRPWMDLTRVGIYGGSAGGQSAMRALLDHGDFYHVAVADCGCHDNRMDKIWWNEQWLGWPVDESYVRNSNSEDAHKLQGRLLLIVGELDTNVDPASTLQVVRALQQSGKTFDFMPIIGAGHGAAETEYGSRLRREFLIRHLNP